MNIFRGKCLPILSRQQSQTLIDDWASTSNFNWRILNFIWWILNFTWRILNSKLWALNFRISIDEFWILFDFWRILNFKFWWLVNFEKKIKIWFNEFWITKEFLIDIFWVKHGNGVNLTLPFWNVKNCLKMNFMWKY